MKVLTFLATFFLVATTIQAFTTQKSHTFRRTQRQQSQTAASFRSSQDSPSSLKAQITEAEAKKSIDKVVAALRKDKEANSDLGKLTKVNNVLGYGSPTAGLTAVRFNASFQKAGKGMSSIPLPFGLGQSNKSEGRGTMVGQVKASVDQKGNVVDCSVFRDLGYGRSFNLKC